jgi:hypothetical protein
VSGSITSNLPAELLDATILYRGKTYRLDSLLPGQQRRIDVLRIGAGASGGQLTDWLSQAVTNVPPAQPVYRGRMGYTTTQPIASTVKRLMFHDKLASATDMSGSLRYLDQSKRLDRDDELILVGRLNMQQGPAEDVTKDAVSPTRLWLGDLPTSGATRPPLAGTLRQETYVRVFIPLRSGKEPPKPAEKPPEKP